MEFPQFFAGQKVGYRDFNALALSAWSSQEDLLRLFFPYGGIFFGYGEELKVEYLGGNQWKIFSGSALLPSGKKVILEKAHYLEQTPVHGEWMMLVMGWEYIAEDFFQDPQIPSVQGFKRMRCQPVFEIRVEKPVDENTIKLARFFFDQPEKFLHEKNPQIPTGFLFFYQERLQQCQHALQEAVSTFEHCEHFFGVSSETGFWHWFFLLQMELQSDFVCYSRLQFALMRLSSLVILFFEQILGASVIPLSDFWQQFFSEQITSLSFQKKDVSRKMHMEEWLVLFWKTIGWTKAYQEKRGLKENRLSLERVLEKRLQQCAAKPFLGQEKWKISEYEFEKKSHFQAQNFKDYFLSTSDFHIRKVISKYPDGHEQERYGVFFNNSGLDLVIKIPLGFVIVVVPMQINLYQPCCFSFFVNGRFVKKIEYQLAAGVLSSWVNFFFVLQESWLHLEENTFRFESENMGFFEAFIYSLGKNGKM